MRNKNRSSSEESGEVRNTSTGKDIIKISKSNSKEPATIAKIEEETKVAEGGSINHNLESNEAAASVK